MCSISSGESATNQAASISQGSVRKKKVSGSVASFFGRIQVKRSEESEPHTPDRASSRIFSTTPQWRSGKSAMKSSPSAAAAATGERIVVFILSIL